MSNPRPGLPEAQKVARAVLAAVAAAEQARDARVLRLAVVTALRLMDDCDDRDVVEAGIDRLMALARRLDPGPGTAALLARVEFLVGARGHA